MARRMVKPSWALLSEVDMVLDCQEEGLIALNG